MTTRAEISEWFDRGVRDGKKNMLVIRNAGDAPAAAEKSSDQTSTPGTPMKIILTLDCHVDGDQPTDDEACDAAMAAITSGVLQDDADRWAIVVNSIECEVLPDA